MSSPVNATVSGSAVASMVSIEALASCSWLAVVSAAHAEMPPATTSVTPSARSVRRVLMIRETSEGVLGVTSLVASAPELRTS